MEKGDKVRVITHQEPYDYTIYEVKAVHQVGHKIFICNGDSCHHIEEEKLERVLL